MHYSFTITNGDNYNIIIINNNITINFVFLCDINDIEKFNEFITNLVNSNHITYQFNHTTFMINTETNELNIKINNLNDIVYLQLQINNNLIEMFEKINKIISNHEKLV